MSLNQPTSQTFRHTWNVQPFRLIAHAQSFSRKWNTHHDCKVSTPASSPPRCLYNLRIPQFIFLSNTRDSDLWTTPACYHQPALGVNLFVTPCYLSPIHSHDVMASSSIYTAYYTHPNPLVYPLGFPFLASIHSPSHPPWAQLIIPYAAERGWLTSDVYSQWRTPVLMHSANDNMNGYMKQKKRFKVNAANKCCANPSAD